MSEQGALHIDPAVIVIFGAGGDLTWRKLIPALYNLFLEHWLPERFTVVGLDRQQMSLEDFRAHLREGVDRFSHRGKAEDRLRLNKGLGQK